MRWTSLGDWNERRGKVVDLGGLGESFNTYDTPTPAQIKPIIVNDAIQNLANSAELPWRILLSTKSEKAQAEIALQAQELTEKHSLSARIIGSEQEVNDQFEALYKLPPSDLKKTLMAMLIPHTLSKIALSTLFGYSVVERDSDDQWLVMATAIDNMATRTIEEAMVMMGDGEDLDIKMRAIHGVIEAEYVPDADNDSGVQVLVGVNMD